MHKRNLNILKLTKNTYGDARRRNYAKEILYNGTPFPKPVEYSDIDNEFKKFVEEKLQIVYDGKIVPTFTLYSNQRFSEYSQTWKHTDENMNLLMNFKTINRENNPIGGTNQGGLYNIPGERSYPILIKEVLDKNGTESYQKFSMKQPYSVDLTYRVNLVTNKYELLNKFNELVNDFFKSRQTYIRVNGHFMPIIFENASDESEYGIEDRKFFSQGYTLKVLAYIIHESDFKVEEFPKRILMVYEGELSKKKPEITIDEYENKFKKQEVQITIKFNEFNEKVSFVFDENVKINKIHYDNIRCIRIHINDTPIFYENGFKIKNNDDVKIKIFKIDISKKSKLIFYGENTDVLIEKDNIPDLVSDEVPSRVEINID